MNFAWLTIILSIFTLVMSIKQQQDKNKSKKVGIKPLNAAEKGEIYHLVIEGEKNKAIKRYRGLAGVDLKTAHDLIVQVETKGMRAFENHLVENLLEITQEDKAKLLAWIDKKESLQAIKYYRKLTNASLPEAKKYIEVLTEERNA